jgi:hypothetical protein
MTASAQLARPVLAFALGLASLLLFSPTVAAADLGPLPLQFPGPTQKGTPPDLPSGPHIEPHSDKAPPPFLAPKGVKNLAAGRKVTTSVKPFAGEPAQITDGKKEPDDEQVVEMKRGRQWVQVDLETPATVYAIVIWHDHRWLQAFHDVIVQVADDADFTENVRTIFNNDVDNSAGFGIGTHKEYFETQWGRAMDAKGVKARYVRCYTTGSTQGGMNACQEVEVYGVSAP